MAEITIKIDTEEGTVEFYQKHVELGLHKKLILLKMAGTVVLADYKNQLLNEFNEELKEASQ